jgi:hypothetical protein
MSSGMNKHQSWDPREEEKEINSSNNNRNGSCYQIIEQLDEEEEKDNVLIKGRRHKKPAKNKKSGRLYEGKQAESKRVSLMDI